MGIQNHIGILRIYKILDFTALEIRDPGGVQ